MTIEFVNAFANNINSGNPAAVCIVDNFLDLAEMQRIATKNNISETAFLKRTSDNNFDIRWFTPVSEAPICVHATLASAHILYKNNIIEKHREIKFFNAGNIFTSADWRSPVPL